MLFPYKQARKTQDLMIKEVYEAVKNKMHLIVHAPTGLGKTAATLAPALGYALEHNLNIFFLTSKNTQHKIAIDTLRLMKSQGMDFNAVDLIGKRWMCLRVGSGDFPVSQFWNYCKEVKEKAECEFYENMKGLKRKLLLHKLDKMSPLHVEELCSLCAKAEVCPFEVACDLAKKANIIVADYFHLLSPTVGEIFLERIKRRLFNSVVIMDESHNLPNRIRDLQSSTISTVILNLAIKETKALKDIELSISCTESLCKIRDALEKLGKDLNLGEDTLVEKKEFLEVLQEAPASAQQTGGLLVPDRNELINLLKLATTIVMEEKKQSFIGLIAEFIQSWSGEDFGFARILSKTITKRGRENISLLYKCLDPSLLMSKFVKECHSVILMSGTLTPTNMYKDLLGFNERTKLVEYENPFPSENRLNLIVSGVTTKFTSRGYEMLSKIADYCARLVNSVPGNVIVFIPSYNLRDEISKYFNKLCEKTIFFEEREMDKKGRDELLEKFKSYKDRGAVLLAVSSGSFGEGIDLLGDYLKCVIIVGIPLSKPDLETRELIKYYQERFGRGWEYGYIYPAIIKCMQNAGRCIRSELDRGVVIFMDDRYGWSGYKKCFPADWNMKLVDVGVAVEKIKGFFG